MNPNNNEWYSNGLQFECTGCGNCCTGPPGYVWFSDEEGRKMANAVGISFALFLRRYARKIGKKWSLLEKKTSHGYDCLFLDRETIPNKAICSIYKSRPLQCKTWPFWKENLNSLSDWNEAARLTPCPGMGKGKVIPLEQIRIQRDQTPD